MTAEQKTRLANRTADAVEVYNDRKPRLGRLLRGRTKFTEVESYETELSVGARVTGAKSNEMLE